MIRIKVICNWLNSKQLIESRWFQKMKPPNYDYLEFVADDNVDYFIILNKPWPGEYYIPAKTIIIQLEPWCNKPFQQWGVKTWGQWASPDCTKFLHVRTQFNYVNGLHWEISDDYETLLNKKILKSAMISTVTTSKFFDPGHIFRIKFLKYLENLNDIFIDIYGYDNQHNFKWYKGSHFPNNKDLGILPYKYYFHAENNDEYNFITEKIWDSILAECVCFYWGCPNISDYVDKACYIELSPHEEDFHQNYLIIKNALANCEWEKRISTIRKEKNRILKNFNVYSTVENVIKSTETPIYIIIHALTTKAGINILNEQIVKIKNSQLYNRCKKIFIFTLGRFEIPLQQANKIVIKHLSSDITLSEQISVRSINNLNLEENAKFLYLHTKGVKYQFTVEDLNDICRKNIFTCFKRENNKINLDIDALTEYQKFHDVNLFVQIVVNVLEQANFSIILNRCNCWKNYMEYALIEYFDKCIDYLDQYDVVGVNLLEGDGKDVPKHFSGNFWWMNLRYYNQHIDHLKTDSHAVEFWAASQMGAKLKNICSSNINHYHAEFPEEIYKSLVDFSINKNS